MCADNIYNLESNGVLYVVCMHQFKLERIYVNASNQWRYFRTPVMLQVLCEQRTCGDTSLTSAALALEPGQSFRKNAHLAIASC